MTRLLSLEQAATSDSRRLAIIRQIQTLAAQDVPIIPYWQSNMIAVGRSNVRGNPEHARRGRHHAVLEDLEVA